MLAVVEKIYAHAGMALSDTARAKIAQWEKGNPQNKMGAFTYSMEAFGFTENEINQHFGEYNKLLGSL